LPAAALTVALVAAGCSDGADTNGGATPTPSGGAATAMATATGSPLVTGGPDASADQTLCKLLTVADLTAAGLEVTKPDTTNTTDVEAFCVYSAGTELDVFVSQTAQAAAEQYNNLIAQNGTPTANNVVSGADESAFGLIPKANRVGVIVRKGKLVYAVTIPEDTANAKTVATNLATIALGRTAGLT
jgi:hypothetical protein